MVNEGWLAALLAESNMLLSTSIQKIASLSCRLGMAELAREQVMPIWKATATCAIGKLNDTHAVVYLHAGFIGV